jgi:chromosome partitioning protein
LRALEPVRGYYDYVFIDTPATVGELLYNALQAADGLLVPVQTDSYNIQSIYQITDVAATIQQTNPALSSIGIVMTCYDGRTKHARQVREIIEKQVEEMGLPFLGVIRQAVAVQEAALFRKSLYKYARRATAAADYMELFNKIETALQEAE